MQRVATKKGENRRAEIIKQAFEIIHDGGLSSLTPACISEKLKQPQSLFFYYFGDMSVLHCAMIEHLMRANAQYVESAILKRNPKNVFDKVATYADANLTWASKHPAQISMLIYASIEKSMKDALSLKELSLRALLGGEEKIYQILIEGIALKQFHLTESIEPRKLAKILHQLLAGSILSIHAFGESGTKEIDQYVQRVDLVLRSFQTSAKDKKRPGKLAVRSGQS